MLGPLVVAIALAPSREAAEALAEADAHYARRAEGAVGPRAQPAQVESAIAAYRRAVSLDRASVEATAGLIRALFFRASFCGATRGERARLLEQARAIGEEGIRGNRERSALLSFWTAVAWGEWALARGRFAAARQGAGGRIRELAEAVIALDPALEQGGGHRLLGRLHDQAPRIPFLTGWVSRELALQHLRQAVALGPGNSVNQLFLAEAILEHDPAHREEARRLLTQCATAPPRPEYQVEDTYYAELARQLLAGLR